MNAFIRSLLLLIAAAPFAFAQKEFGFDNRMSSGQPYLSPEETVKRMKVPPEFEVKLFAGEPLVVNPIAFTIDEKGRIWVVESFEYPSRTPKGKKPRDRIVILEDTKGTGVCDKRTVFCEGKDFPETFDLASGIEVGNGGVYVGAAPYLWFIENKNDKPGKFEILLKGFGSQDTHEMLNTFQWGPDGWLYGLHGIYTESKITTAAGEGPEQKMNAGVWRYHPQKKKFEVYAEGTSNPWGMDWRNTDGQFIVCCCVIPHLFHIVPGGIYKRQAGASQNPYAYGYINEICDHTFHKESGWAHAGLISLDVPHMPERFRNSVIFGSIHGNSLKQNILKPNGSTYTASRGDDFLTCGDKNFRPINLRWGPNGDIYIIDWHDQNPCHQAAADSWDYEHGRVYRIQFKGVKPLRSNDLSKATPEELSEFALRGATPWHRRTALRLIREMAEESKFPIDGAARVGGQRANESSELAMREELYINATGRGLSEFLAKGQTLIPEVHAWRVHFNGGVPDLIKNYRQFAILAKTTESAAVRRELASYALLRGKGQAIAVLLHELMLRKDDDRDPIIPSLIWNGYEKLLMLEPAVANQELDWLQHHADASEMIRNYILPRVMRRLAAVGKPEYLALCVRFVGSSKDASVLDKALGGLTVALKDQSAVAPAEWKAIRDELLAMNEPKITRHVNALSVAFHDPEAAERAFKILNTDNLPAAERAEALRIIVQLKHPQAAATCVSFLRQSKDESLRIEAARLLVAFDNPRLGQEVIDTWAMYPKAIHTELVTSLASRKEWAKALLRALKEKKIDRAAVSDSAITRIQAFKDAALDALIAEAWGRSRATPKELQKLIDDTRLDLGKGPGSFVRGKAVFEQQCAKCHKFEGKGSDVGPALDGAGRDIEYLLVNVLDPNRIIGAPYFVRQALLLDGQLIQGVLAEEDEKSITLKIENAVLKKIAKADLDGPVKVLEKSLMPEGLSAGMKPQDFRDLICYVMAHPFVQSAKVNGKNVTGSVTGLLPLPDEIGKPIIIEATFTASDAIKTTLLVGSANAYEAFVDEKPLGKAAGTERSLKPDHDRFDVMLAKGPHTLKLVLQSKWATKGVTLRFLDPERKISYQD